MKQLVLIWLGVSLLAVSAVADTATFRQGELGYTSSLDAFIRTDAGRVEWNTGGADTLSVLSSGGTTPTKQTFIKYADIFGAGPGQVPAGQVITSATLRLNFRQEQIAGGHNNPYYVYPVLIDVPNYGTNDGPAAIGQLTHRKRSHGPAGPAWGTAGTGLNGPIADEDYDTSRLIVTTIAGDPYGSGITEGFYELDVAAIVADWYAGTISNYGFLIRPDESGFTGGQFRSNEWSDVSLRPQLVIEYVPEPVTMSLLVLGGAALIRRRR